MPVIKSAIKKLRKDRALELRNDEFRAQLKDTLRKVRKNTSDLSVLQEAYSVVDKAAKKNLIHKNKAARMKAQIAKTIRPAKVSKTKSTTTSK